MTRKLAPGNEARPLQGDSSHASARQFKLQQGKKKRLAGLRR